MKFAQAILSAIAVVIAIFALAAFCFVISFLLLPLMAVACIITLGGVIALALRSFIIWLAPKVY